MMRKMKLVVLESADAEKLWYADGLRFTCTQCGNCCTGGPGVVWISREEIGRLAEHLKLTVDQTIERDRRDVGGKYSLKESRNARGEYDCVFLHEETTERVSKNKDGHDERIVHTKRAAAPSTPPARCSAGHGRSGRRTSEAKPSGIVRRSAVTA